MSAGLRALLLSALACVGNLAMADARLWPPSPSVERRIEAASQLLDRLEEALPESASDIESLAWQLDYDFEAAVDYVRDNIRYEPYNGVLRGPDGTASVGRGNAWDQALLVAALLNTLGADAQIVTGPLSGDDASRLLAGAFSARGTADDTFDAAAVMSIVEGYDSAMAERVIERLARWREVGNAGELDRDAATIADTLLKMMRKASTPLASEGDSAALRAAIGDDYAWVRWRDAPGSPWQTEHPAFAGSAAPATTAARFFAGEAPAELQHRVALQLFIERSTAGNSERIAVMSRFERPTAQLYRQQLVLGMGPLSADGGNRHAFVVPILNDGTAPGAQAVTALGLTASAGDVGSAAADVFATVSGSFGDALGALGDAADSERGAAPRLTGIILAVDVIAPGGDVRHIERRIADLREQSPAAFPGSAAFSAVLDIDIGAEDGPSSTRERIQHEQKVLRALPVLYALARHQLSLREAQKTPALRALTHDRWPDYDILSAAFLPPDDAGRLVFRPGPMLAMRRTFDDPERGQLTTADILANPVTVLRRSAKGSVVVDRAGAVRQGVRETLLESDLVRVSHGWDERPPARLIRDRAALERDEGVADWPAAARAQAADDLAGGHVLGVVDAREPQWWRIDPQSGRTLGMGRYGGQEVAEYIVMVSSAALSSYLFYRSVQGCDDTYADNRGMADCCIVGNLIGTYTSSALGAAGPGVPTGPAAAWIQHPWASTVGYVSAALSFDVVTGAAFDAAAEGPMTTACQAYVNR